MAAGRIIVDLLFRTGSFETDTKKAAKQLKELKKEAADAGKALAAGAALYGAAAVAFVKSAIDSADAASKAAVSAGVTTEAFTGLAYAAELAGIEQTTLSKTLAKINTDIATGEKAYAKLGISLTDSTGKAKTADQVLGELADVFAKLPDGAQKSALAAQLFGEKIGPQLLPLLNSGKAGIKDLTDEAARLGVVIDTETGRAAEAFNDNISRLTTQVRGLGLQIAERLLPQLVQLSERLVRNAKDFGLAQGAAVTFFEAIFGGTEPVDVAKRKIVELEAAIEATNQQVLAAVDRGDEASVRREAAILQRQQAELERLRAQLKIAEADVAANAPTAPKAPTGGVPGGLIGGGGAPKVSELQKYLDGLNKQRQGLFDITIAEQALADIQAGRLGKITSAQEAQVLALAREIDATREAQRVAQERADFRRQEEEAIKAFEEEQAARRASDLASLKSAGQSVFEATRTPAEKLNIELTRLNDLLNSGAINWDTYARAVFAAQDAYDATLETVEESATALEEVGNELGLTFSSAFEDAIVNGAKFKDLLLSLEKDIVRIITRKLVTEPLANVVSGFIGGSGGSGIIGAIGSFFGGAFARGGDVTAGRQYLVGEAGPEMFVPRTAGAIVPSVPTMGAGRTINQTVNFHVSGQIDRRTQMQLAAEAGRAVTMAQLRNS